MREAFDVFFSYSTADHASVERVARALHDRGIRIFLDRWYLAAGQPWPQALEQTLASCNAVAIFLGASGLGPWQQRERDLALDRQGREAGFPVIPVLLAGSDPALGFLRLNTWVDLSANAGEEALDLLVAAIRGKPPGPLGRQQAETARAAVSPYRGLRPFREEDEPFFFGRIAFTETLVATVARKSFVAVVGASGSGKSSVVRAGLIPRLRRGENGRIWEAIGFVPTDRPLASMAAALLPLLEPDLTEVDRLTEVGKLARALGDGEVALRDVTARILAKQPGTDRLLLFADQWEELYTLCADEADRATFIAQLLEVARSGPISVVLTVRGDFMGRVLANRALSDRLQDAVVNIGPMTRDELTETITRPAGKTGLAFDPGLVETILDDVGDEPGNLPLLEFLLEALWTERRGPLMHYEAYHRLGRVAGAIAHRADDVFNRELDEGEREAARRLLIRMVRPGEGAEDTRQRAAMPAADPVAEATVRKLADARLVVTELDAAINRETVEVAHEALIQRWQLLRGWVDQDRDFLRTRERIATQAHLWEKEERSPDRLLPPGRPLAEGEDLLANRRPDLDEKLVEYLIASSAAEASRRQAAQASQRRQLFRARFAAAVMVILALAASGFAGWWGKERRAALHFARLAQQNADEALQQAGRADASRGEALQRLADLQRQESIRLAGMARQETGGGNAVNGMLLALEALPGSSDPPDRPLVGDAVGALIEAMLEQRELAALQGHDEAIASLTFSQDGKRIAISSYDGDVRIWDAFNGEQMARLWVGNNVHQVELFPGGTRAMTLSSYDVPRVWDVDSKNLLFTLGDEHDEKERPWRVSLSPDGRRAVTYGDDLGKVAYLWDADTGERLRVLSGHSEYIEMVTFSHDGERVLTGSEDHTARIWDAKSGSLLKVLRGHTSRIAAAAFSADRQRAITGSSDGTARIWNANTGKVLFVLPGHSEGDDFRPWLGIRLAIINGDGSRAITQDSERVRLWDATSAKELRVLPEQCDDWSFIGGKAKLFGIIAAVCGKQVRFWGADVGNETDEVLMTAGQEIRRLVMSDYTRNPVFAGTEPKGSQNLSYMFPTVFETDARVWDLFNEEMTSHRGVRPPPLTAEFADDGHQVLMRWPKNALTWTPSGGVEDVLLDTVDVNYSSEIVSSAIHPETIRQVVRSKKGPMRLLDGRSGAEIAVLHEGEHDWWRASAVFSSDGSRLVTAVRSSRTESWEDLRLWDGASGALVADLIGHRGSLAVKFSARGTTVATSNKDGAIWLWNAADGRLLAELPASPYGIGGTLLALSPEGTRTLEQSHGLLLRDTISGREILKLGGHGEQVDAASFSADGSRIVTGSKGSIRIWDTASGEEQIVFRSHLKGRCVSAEFSPDGERLVTAHDVGESADIRVWPIPRSAERLVAEARGRLPRQLSDEERRRYFLPSRGGFARDH